MYMFGNMLSHDRCSFIASDKFTVHYLATQTNFILTGLLHKCLSCVKLWHQYSQMFALTGCPDLFVSIINLTCCYIKSAALCHHHPGILSADPISSLSFSVLPSDDIILDLLIIGLPSLALLASNWCLIIPKISRCVCCGAHCKHLQLSDLNITLILKAKHKVLGLLGYWFTMHL